ncbi:hypothetical protein PVAP13_2KG260516 [Panicum virgatum]|uniref:Uncharacterized protein n=1 Tax=Panicum virgatum TaxID=38727 RepID=A0A8T0VYX6_PANVG|nr:hypothetical protein PVAP13_2KG260516 [Panicum virgatum]
MWTPRASETHLSAILSLSHSFLLPLSSLLSLARSLDSGKAGEVPELPPLPPLLPPLPPSSPAPAAATAAPSFLPCPGGPHRRSLLPPLPRQPPSRRRRRCSPREGWACAGEPPSAPRERIPRKQGGLHGSGGQGIHGGGGAGDPWRRRRRCSPREGWACAGEPPSAPRERIPRKQGGLHGSGGQGIHGGGGAGDPWRRRARDLHGRRRRISTEGGAGAELHGGRRRSTAGSVGAEFHGGRRSSTVGGAGAELHANLHGKEERRWWIGDGGREEAGEREDKGEGYRDDMWAPPRRVIHISARLPLCQPRHQNRPSKQPNG